MNGEEGGTVVRAAVPIYGGTQEVGGDNNTHN
jgi:hypothetical protein